MDKPKYLIGDIIRDERTDFHYIVEDIENTMSRRRYTLLSLESGDSFNWFICDVDDSEDFNKVA